MTNVPHPLKLLNCQHQFTYLVSNFLFAFSPWGFYIFSMNLTMHFQQHLLNYYLILISVCSWRFSGSLIICNVARHKVLLFHHLGLEMSGCCLSLKFSNCEYPLSLSVLIDMFKKRWINLSLKIWHGLVIALFEFQSKSEYA